MDQNQERKTENERAAKKTPRRALVRTKTGEAKRVSLRRAAKRGEVVIEERASEIKKPFPFAVIFSICAIVAVAMYVLSLRITADELIVKISDMKDQISAAKEEQNALEVRLNAKYDLTEIERIATEEYGMVSKDTLAKKYVTISEEDEIEVLDPKRDEANTGETQS